MWNRTWTFLVVAAATVGIVAPTAINASADDVVPAPVVGHISVPADGSSEVHITGPVDQSCYDWMIGNGTPAAEASSKCVTHMDAETSAPVVVGEPSQLRLASEESVQSDVPAFKVTLQRAGHVL